jgi:uncharacterized protein
MLLFAVALGASGCRTGQSPTQSHDPEVVLLTRGGDQHVKVEIARTDPERERGLMYRQKLESGRGMIFLFEAPRRNYFWMKNTYIPLDMIFIGADKHVVYVEENAEPLTLNNRGPDHEDTQYVLEVPGGWARAHGVERGVECRFVNVE